MSVVPSVGLLSCHSFQKVIFSTSLLRSFSIPSQSGLLIQSHPRRSFSSTSSSIAVAAHLGHQIESADVGLSAVTNFEEGDSLGVEEEKEDESLAEHQLGTKSCGGSLTRFSIPKLTVQEKKDLTSYAHSLGTNLKTQQVGKSGVTTAVAAAMAEVLEVNELLKLKIHGSCPGELSEVIKQLENATGSAAVSQIGRTVILYRPSLAKMKEEGSDNSRKYQKIKPAKLNVQKRMHTARAF